MSQQPIPDVRVFCKNVVNGLRLACFPKTLWRCADRLSAGFVPTRSGSEAVRERVIEQQTDPRLRLWLCEEAEIEELIYCRMALHIYGDLIEQADEQSLNRIGGQLLRLPALGPMIADGLLILRDNLKEA